MPLSYLRRRVSYIAPALVLAPFLMGADGGGCGPGAPFGNGTEDGGSSTTGGSSSGNTSTGTSSGGKTPTGTTSGGCGPNDCQGDAPVLPCPSDAVSESSCVASAGGCEWSARCAVVGCECPATGLVKCFGGQTPITTTLTSGSCSCPVSVCPDAGPFDAAVACACPAVVVTKCPDGTSPPPEMGPPPCYCPVTGACPAQDAAASDATALDAATRDAATSCASDADCPTGSACGFPEAQACAVSRGECFPLPGVECNAIALGCACDGTEVNVACNGLPSGYAPKPLRHTGPCADGG